MGRSSPRPPRTGRTRLAPAQVIALAQRLIMQRDFAGAARLLQPLVQALPADPAVCHTQAMLLHLQGDSEAALPWMERALALTPDHAERWNDHGNLLLRLQRTEEATRAYERSLALAGDTPAAAHACNNLGRLCSAQSPEQAVRWFERATQLAPELPQPWHQLSQLLPSLGRTEEGVTAWARATVLRPQQASPEHLARAWLQLGQQAKAIAVYQGWLQREPGHPVPTHHLAALRDGQVPARASDAYVTAVFDGFAERFDAQLARLDYQAPALIQQALQRLAPQAATQWDVADLGCGTGLCGPLMAPWARRLVGCDLSAPMLQHARQRACYSELHAMELTAFLQARPASFELLVSADTLCYFADLHPVLQAAATALREAGALIFTVEALSDAAVSGPYRLLPSGRYQHGPAYVRSVAGAAGFTVHALQPVCLRQEAGQAVAGWLVTLQRPPSAPLPAA